MSYFIISFYIEPVQTIEFQFLKESQLLCHQKNHLKQQLQLQQIFIGQNVPK